MSKELNYVPISDNKYKHYIDNDCYSEAKKRIIEVIKSVDDCIITFSGGKDSLVVLNMVQEVYDELGIKKKLKVCFFDEEIIPNYVIDFVTDIYNSGKYDFRYYAIPLESHKFVLGQNERYVQWDKNREWVRQPPDFAITLSDDEYVVYTQYNRDEFICKDIQGKVAMFNGIRASESLFRLNACHSKPHKTYINKSNSKRIIHVKPIYDWLERDVFLYFLKNDIKYCPQYDVQHYNSEELRVATPLHSEASKKFSKIKTADPEYYDRICKIFPEMILQNYQNSLCKNSLFNKYPHTIKGLLQYIDDTIEDDYQNNLCKSRIHLALKQRKNNLKRNDTSLLLGGYSLLYLFKVVSNGQYKRNIPFSMMITLEDYLFEGKTKEDYEKDLLG